MFFTDGCAAREEAVFEVIQASLVPPEEAGSAVHRFRVVAIALVLSEDWLFFKFQICRQAAHISNFLLNKCLSKSDFKGIADTEIKMQSSFTPNYLHDVPKPVCRYF